MSEKQIEISKIVIKIGKSEEELTVAQAKKLLEALQELMGKPNAWYPYVYPVYYPGWTYTTVANGSALSGSVTTYNPQLTETATATYCVS